MRHFKRRDELQLLNSPPGLSEFEGRSPGDVSVDDSQTDSEEELDDSDITELGDDGAMPSLADVAVAPPRGDGGTCSWNCEAGSSCVELKHLDMSLLFHFLMSKAEDLHTCIFKGEGRPKREELVAAVKMLILTCQPFFNHLGATAWGGAMSQHCPLLLDKLQDFSQQLCDKLEQLVLTYAEHSLLCLAESEPDGMSHFCMGQTQLGPLRLTAFRYCRAAPYLGHMDTGLYKRMRWNVEMLEDQQQTEEEEQGGESEGMLEPLADTEFYFLCYEDISSEHADAGSQRMARMWSIGQWVQVNPDLAADNIYDWITCEVPQADYRRLLFLGTEEPSCRTATEHLLQLLLSQ